MKGYLAKFYSKAYDLSTVGKLTVQRLRTHELFLVQHAEEQPSRKAHDVSIFQDRILLSDDSVTRIEFLSFFGLTVFLEISTKKTFATMKLYPRYSKYFWIVSTLSVWPEKTSTSEFQEKLCPTMCKSFLSSSSSFVRDLRYFSASAKMKSRYTILVISVILPSLKKSSMTFGKPPV